MEKIVSTVVEIIRNETVLSYLEGREYVTICPECTGGLSTPREPAEIIGEKAKDVIDGNCKVISRVGVDVTKEYMKGAEVSLEGQKIRCRVGNIEGGKSFLWC